MYDTYTEILERRKEEERISLAAKTELKEMNDAAALIQVIKALFNSFKQYCNPKAGD